MHALLLPDRLRPDTGRVPAPYLPTRVPAAVPGSTLPAHSPRVLTAEERGAFGPLAPLVIDSAVTDVFVSGAGEVWVDRGAGAVRAPTPSLRPEALSELARHLIALGGRHLDEATPCADVRLGDGIRVHAVLPPIATGGAELSIRLPRPGGFRLDDLGLDEGAVAELRRALAARETLLISGATGSGKTTLLSAWLSEADPTDRIIVLEDVSEARIRHPHVVCLECRHANLEGAGEIDLARLVREALRMRPDRLVVGECRGAEVREFLAALNTGHRGGAGTLHANSLADVPARLEAVGLLAGLGVEVLARQAVSGIDRIVHLRREEDGARTATLGSLALDARERLAIVPG